MMDADGKMPRDLTFVSWSVLVAIQSPAAYLPGLGGHAIDEILFFFEGCAGFRLRTCT
jgi:hypothetical protein